MCLSRLGKLFSQNWSIFRFSSPEIIGVKVCHRRTDRQTDGQTDRQILWHHIRGCADFLFQLNLLPPYSLCSQGDKLYPFVYLKSTCQVYYLSLELYIIGMDNDFKSLWNFVNELLRFLVNYFKVRSCLESKSNWAGPELRN